MSYLVRTGTGRNNISWSTTANSSTKYLRRTSTGRNNIAWTTIPSGSTYNILQRNGTGRNNVLWSNLKIGPDLSANAIKNNMHVIYEYDMDSSGNDHNYMAFGIWRGSNATLARDFSGSASEFRSITYQTGKIVFGSWGYSTSTSWGNRNSDSVMTDYVGYTGIVIFCSSAPPSDYLSAIKSFTDCNNNTYNVRFTPRYGFSYYLYGSQKSNALYISLNTTNMPSYSTSGKTISINFA